MESLRDQQCFQDIPGYHHWVEIQMVEKGYSKDQKYHIITDEQEHLLLRCSLAVRRRITIGCNSKLKSRLTPIRPRGLACNCTFLSA